MHGARGVRAGHLYPGAFGPYGWLARVTLAEPAPAVSRPPAELTSRARPGEQLCPRTGGHTITGQQVYERPASIRRRWPLSVMTAPRAPRDPIHMKSKTGKPVMRKIINCWSCERPVVVEPGRSSYHCESCDVQGSDEPTLVRAKMTEQTYYFAGWDGRCRLEDYVEHNDSSLSSPA